MLLRHHHLHTNILGFEFHGKIAKGATCSAFLLVVATLPLLICIDFSIAISLNSFTLNLNCIDTGTDLHLNTLLFPVIGQSSLGHPTE